MAQQRWQRELADPRPAGLLCVGLATFLTGCAVARWITGPTGALILALLLIVGGVGSTTAGLFAIVRGETHASVVFVCYGMFFSIIALSQIIVNVRAYHFPISNVASTVFFAPWVLFSFSLFLGSFFKPVLYMLYLLFITLYFLLALIGFAVAGGGYTPNNTLEVVSGYFLVLAGLCAVVQGGVSVSLRALKIL